jgi:hypothetical protein
MCDAIRYGDTTLCGPCGLQWDTNDPGPPTCGMKVEQRTGRERRELDLKHLRQRFERWAVMHRFSVTQNVDGEYFDRRTQAAWMGCKFGNGLT